MYALHVGQFQKNWISMSDKPMSIFDHFNNITTNKVGWSNLSETNRKSFSPYMINRLLSMNTDYIDLVNELQKYTVGILEARDVYQLYIDLIPKKKQFNKYIKASKEAKYNANLVELLSKHFSISLKESMEYLDLLLPDRQDTVVDILKKYGKTDKEIKVLIK